MAKLLSAFKRGIEKLTKTKIQKVPINSIKPLMIKDLVKHGNYIANHDGPHITATRWGWPYIKNDKDIVDSLRKTIRAGKIHKIPPIELHAQDGNLFLLDGHHRLAAHRLEGLTHIKAKLRNYSPEEIEDKIEWNDQ